MSEHPYSERLQRMLGRYSRTVFARGRGLLPPPHEMSDLLNNIQITAGGVAKIESAMLQPPGGEGAWRMLISLSRSH